MFAEIMIDEPLERIAEDWNFFEDRVIRQFKGLRIAGRNVYGLHRRDIGAGAIHDPDKGDVSLFYEIGPSGLVECHFRPMTVHVTTGGTPHHVPHNFGFWHINDKDELYLPLPGERPGEPGIFIVVMGVPTGNETDAVAWYCEKCLTLLRRHVVETGRLGFNALWANSAKGIAEYNADVHNRTCRECGHVNPLAYPWNSAQDTPEQAEARKLW